MQLKAISLHFVLYCSGLVSVIIFCLGFFPFSLSSNEIASKADFPGFDEYILEPNEDYAPSVDRTFFMIIDALRIDFIEQRENFPYLHELILKKEACLLTLKVLPPTVTMPRIKALTSGTLPNFLDVVLNLGSSRVNIDTFLNQMKQTKDKIVFAGDDTWTKMFPKIFHRTYANQDSLFVNDFYLGDTNVTQSLKTELEKDDWKLLILHYLGLDHIGHVENPFSKFVPDKLKEMDGALKMMHLKIQEWNKKSQKPSIIILTGDHGMRDTGGHGGSSYAETHVPLIVIGNGCKSNLDTVYQQVDLATSFSVLNGLPIPFSSIGTIIPELLESYPKNSILYSLYYSNQKLMDMLERQISEDQLTNQESYVQLQEAKSFHKMFLNDPKNYFAYNISYNKYLASSASISSLLSSKFFNVEIFLMIVGIVSSFFTSLNILCLVLFGDVEEISARNNWVYNAIYLLAGFFLKIFISDLFEHTNDLKNNTAFLIFWILMHVNWRIFQKQLKHLNFKKINLKAPLILHFIAFGQIFSIFTLTSSSFIEEEHQIWYYFTNSLFVLFILWESRRSKFSWISFVWRFAFLMCHVFIKRLNQTGDKWLALPDVGDWLVEEENRVWLNSFLGAGLLIVFALVALLFSEKRSNTFITMCLMLIFVFRTFAKLNDSHSFIIVQIFWILLVITIIVNNFPVIQSILQKADLQASDKVLMFRSFLVTLCLVSCLLHKPQNVILIGLCLISCIYMNKLCNKLIKKDQRVAAKVFTHFWIGKMFFFYQGNSNSLSSIDLNAGYVGLTQFSLPLVGFFLTINTFNGPLLSLSMLLHHIINDFENSDSATRDELTTKLIKYIAAIVVWPSTWFLVVITLLRNHLFIWTVFSPKLLYELYFSGLMFFALLIILVARRIL